MQSTSPRVAEALAAAPAMLPLTQSALRATAGVCHLKSQRASTLFPEAGDPEAALAGLLLRVGCWNESHGVAQDISSAEGSYWHAILHRMEPDASNSRYWFRHVGTHAIFSNLLERAQEILSGLETPGWRLKGHWDPSMFIDWCEEGLRAGGVYERAACEIQLAEWNLLFDWCARPRI